MEIAKYYDQIELINYLEKIVTEHGDSCKDITPSEEVEKYIKNLN